MGMGTLLGISALATGAYAAATRTKAYGAFATVSLGIHALSARYVVPQIIPQGMLMKPLWLLWCGGVVALHLHVLTLTKPKMHGKVFRAFISWPGQMALGWTMGMVPLKFLSIPVVWMWGGAPAVQSAIFGLGFVGALFGLLQSIQDSPWKDVHIEIGTGKLDLGDKVVRVVETLGEEVTSSKALRIIQITDPHIGPFCSVERLKATCEEIVGLDPDFVFLTGDFLTMESYDFYADGTHPLSHALKPLRKLKGKCFACFGNHDVDSKVAEAAVRYSLAQNDVRLLEDEAVVVDNDIQIVGVRFEWYGRQRGHRTKTALLDYPREEGKLRLLLMHDPSSFHHCDDVDLTFSGHTHGGQIGLLSLGINFTALQFWGNKVPDQGLWGKHRSRLIVHRGQGHYGLPLRFGVPTERSIYHIHRKME